MTSNQMKIYAFTKQLLICILTLTTWNAIAQSFPVVGTDQSRFYNNSTEINAPSAGQPFYGQDASHPGISPSFTDNGNGTVTDNNTGLTWQKSADLNNDGTINKADELTYEDAAATADTFSLAGFNDWRLPTIKELYSLIQFDGADVSGLNPPFFKPFIDTAYFNFAYGDTLAGDRIIDAQYASSTLYVSTTMGGAETMFGVNFADGRIKGYGLTFPGGGEKTFYVKFVRGRTDYGINAFHDNGDGTVSDNATGLMWATDDNGEAVLWENALESAENSTFAGYNDWRLPNAKELQGIVDYTRSPATSQSAAINPVFNCSQIVDEGNNSNYPFYWASTTHVNTSPFPGDHAVYVCFGEALGWMQVPPNSGNYVLMDVHGAGAQRSDPKTGDPSNFPYGFGPQGDVIRIYNYFRMVRNISPNGINEPVDKTKSEIRPNPSKGIFNVKTSESNSSIRIFDASGRLIIEKTRLDAGLTDIRLEKPGIYTLQLLDGQKTTSGQVVITPD